MAEYLFDDENNMTRIDMSEYQERHSVSRLVGAPPGYVGYDEGGQLTEAVRRRPYSVVLLDEIEKAHPDVFNTLLQVLDDGRLTDNKGRVVNFKLRAFNKMLEKRGIFMTATDDAINYLMNKGYDPSFGARPLKRVLQQEVLNKLSKEILAGTVNDGDRITLDYFEETGLVFRPTE